MKNKERKWDTITLLLGVMLGVMGSLFANIVERYFIKFGFAYESIVALLFFGFVFYLKRGIKK